MGTRSGFTLVELVMALALLAVTGLLVAVNWPSPLGPASNALRGFITQARLEAVARNEPIAVVYDAVTGQYQQRHAPGSSFQASELCASGEVLRSLDLRDFRGVSLGPPGNGLIWLPTGYGRTCMGGGAFNQTHRMTHRGLEARIFVSRAGRVRSEVELR